MTFTSTAHTVVRISLVSHSLRNIHCAKAITFLIELFPHCDNAKWLFSTNSIICIQPMFQKNLFMRILSKLMCEIGYFTNVSVAEGAQSFKTVFLTEI